MTNIFTKKVSLVGVAVLIALIGVTTAFISVRASENSQLAGWIDQIIDFAILDGNHQNNVRGWALDKLDENADVDVLVSTDAEGIYIIGVAKTDVERRDVATAYSTENAGFTWQVPRSYDNGSGNTFYFWAHTANTTDKAFIGSAYFEPRDAGLGSSLDSFVGSTWSGWAIDFDGENIPNQAVPVMLYIDGEYVTSTLANGERKDVDAAFPGLGGFHGWNMDIIPPQKYRDGLEHRVEVWGLEYTEGNMVIIGEPQFRYIWEDGSLNLEPQVIGL